jgi:hypothetical protein
LRIVYLPDAEHSSLWPEIEAMLEPAARLGGCEINEPEDTIWAAFDGDDMAAAFTLRMTNEALELRCAGGTRLWEWVDPLDAMMTEIGRAYGLKLHCRGRKGWARFAKRCGWKFVGNDEREMPMFEKEV